MDRPSAPAAPLLAFTRFQALCRFSRARAASSSPGPVLCASQRGQVASSLPGSDRASPCLPRTAPLSRASDAWLPASLCLKHSSSFGPSPRIRLLRPLLTSRSGSTPSPFQAQGEISPGKNAFLHRTTAGSTPPPLGHESFAVHGPLALVTASYPVLVHRHAVYAPRFLPTLGHPHAVALHFTRCDQLVAGLPPAGMRPCRAHHRKAPNFRPGLIERIEVWPASATMRKREAIPPPQSPGAADGIAVLHKGRRAKPPETVPRRSRDPRQPYSRAPVRRSPCRSRCRDRSPRR